MNNKIEYLKNLKDIGTKLSDFEEIKAENEKYTILGKGNFGYVEKMKSKKNNKIYAIKKIDKNSPQFNDINFQRETELMLRLDHESIMKLYGYFYDKENINKYKEIYKDKKNKNDLDKLNEDISIYCLVLEIAENGSLRKFYNNKIINRDKNLVPIEQKDIINILKKILTGLKYLQDEGIMHRDISPDNILLDKNNNVKITDFGISAIHKDYKAQNQDIEEDLISKETVVGRYAFASPEVHKGESYDYSCDIYSLGLTFLCLMSYENPIIITTYSKGKKIRDIKKGNIHQNYNPYLQKLILRMIEDDPNLRPTSSEAYDELEIIEIFIDKPNNKIIERCLDELNKNNNSMSNDNYNKINKKFLRLNTENINTNNNNIREEFGFSSSNSIYSQDTSNPQPTPNSQFTPNPQLTQNPQPTPNSQFTPNPQLTQNPQPTPNSQFTPNPQLTQNPQFTPNPQTIPNPQFTPNPQTTPNPQFTPNPQTTPNPQFTPNPQPYETFQRTPQDFLYNNNHLNNNSLNVNNYYTNNNNQYNFYNTQNNFRSFRRMQTFQRPTFQMPLSIPASSEVVNLINNEKEIERERERERERENEDGREKRNLI